MYQPDYPAALGLITHLNIEELKEILNEDDKFESILQNHKQIKDWETEKEMIIASNRSLAEYNLSKEPEYLQAKEKVAQLSEQGEELCKQVQAKLEEFKSKSSGVSLDTTLALLETAAAQSEELSEAIAQKFLAGETDLEKFLDEFSKERRTMHLRKVKVDKMTELLRSRQGGGSLFGNNSAPYPPYQAPQGYYQPPAVPYPMGPVNMPMPGMFRNHF